MFHRKRAGDKEKQRNTKARQARASLAEAADRKVFGFKCSPDIPATLKKEADGLHVPLFALAEHCLQLGAIQLRFALGDSEEAEELRNHLVKDHTQSITIENTVIWGNWSNTL